MKKKRLFKKVLIGFAVLFLILFITAFILIRFDVGVFFKTCLTDGKLGIVKHPSVANFHRGELGALPSYDPKSGGGWQVDLRGCDLTKLDLKNRLADLSFANFDSVTKWPQTLPASFKPDVIMEVGKNPGLGIRNLHKKGINGKGIGIAIIDSGLLVDHVEYRDRIKLYEEIHLLDRSAQMHGPAVASIAVGKTVGVAPEADLYYIAETHINLDRLIRKAMLPRIMNSLGLIKSDASFERLRWKAVDFHWLAKSMERILEINKTLPDANRIRVISVSVGWSSSDSGYDEMMEIVDRAKKEGLFIVSSSLAETFGFSFHGLGREPWKNPDDALSYEPGMWWANRFYKGKLSEKEMLLAPMDSRCVASPTGNEDYVFYRQGGWSWSIPYIAGLYALACQVKPDVTPDEFWAAALKTGVTREIEKEGRKYKLGKIVNPEKLIEELQNKHDHSIRS